jgi:hypothetical protein
LEYLNAEYEKNPEQFPFPKEKLAEIVEMENEDFDQLRD